jgi:type III pantothenate kinase
MESNRLVIDIGNTRVKFGLFTPTNELVTSGYGWDSLTALASSPGTSRVIVASVSDEAHTSRALQLFPGATLFSPQLQLPLTNGYTTPHTLGVDRLANAVAAHHLSGGAPALAIDAGTCLKFDFTDGQGIYHGGSISPGLTMRFQAMHAFTANLPLIEEWNENPLIGKNTKDSMVSGALNGMQAEISCLIARYLSVNSDLMIFLTGGDAHFFDLEVKNPIFAHENLTLLGLKLILDVNE